MRPGAIVKRLGLKNPIFLPSASYGHMGRKPEMLKVEYKGDRGGKLYKEFETFTWEKLDYVDKLKEVFGFRFGYKGYVKKEFAPKVSSGIGSTDNDVRSYSNYQPKSSSGAGKRGRPRKDGSEINSERPSEVKPKGKPGRKPGPGLGPGSGSGSHLRKRPLEENINPEAITPEVSMPENMASQPIVETPPSTTPNTEGNS